MNYFGDIRVGKILYIHWNSSGLSGQAILPSTAGTIEVYKDDGTTQSTAGITDTRTFDTVTGRHMIKLDTSADGAFYAAGHEFSVVLTAATVDGQTVNAVLAHFSIENRSAVMPTVAGRTLDVSATGEAGLDWANIGSPTTAVDMTGTQIKTAHDIIALLPTALVSGRMDSSVGAMAANVLTATAINASAITSAKFATDAIDSNALAASAVTEINAGGSGGLDAAGVRAAIGMAAANLDTQLTALASLIPSASVNANTLLDLADAIEVGHTLRKVLRGLAAVQLGNGSGLDGAVIAYERAGGGADRVSSTIAGGNRVVTLSLG